MKIIRKKYLLMVIVLFFAVFQLLFLIPVKAAQLTSRGITISSSIVSATNVTYDLSFDSPGGYTLGSIAVEFCQQSPIPGDACTAPSGFDAGSATLDQQSGETGFSIHASTTTGKIVIGRVPAAASAGTYNYTFGGITNPDNVGTFYARVYTHDTNDGTGAYNNFGGIALVVNARIDVEGEVPPFLELCVGITISGLDCSTASGDSIDFGELSSSEVKAATSQFMMATNADNGVSVRITGNTMTSGNNIINAIVAPQVSAPGSSQFGLNLRANTNPPIGQDPVGVGTIAPSANYNTPNNFMFADEDVLASDNVPTDWHKFTVSYIVNVPPGQHPGIYTTSMVFVCLANF
jgi:hypothetical protein